MSSITVTPNLQTKDVSPTTSTQYIYPSAGYCGLSQVIVSAIQSQDTLLSLTGQPYSNDGMIFDLGKNYSTWKFWMLFGPNTANFNGFLMGFCIKNANNKYDMCTVDSFGQGSSFNGPGVFTIETNSDTPYGIFAFNGTNVIFSGMAGSNALYTGYNYYLYIVVN